MTNKVIQFTQKAKKPSKKIKPAPLDGRAAQSLINTLASDSFNVFIPNGQHGEERMMGRDFTLPDIIEILREGIIREEPRWESGTWKYKVEVIGFRGRIGAAVVTLIMKNKTELRVATVMWLDRR